MTLNRLCAPTRGCYVTAFGGIRARSARWTNSMHLKVRSANKPRPCPGRARTVELQFARNIGVPRRSNTTPKLRSCLPCVQSPESGGYISAVISYLPERNSGMLCISDVPQNERFTSFNDFSRLTREADARETTDRPTDLPTSSTPKNFREMG